MKLLLVRHPTVSVDPGVCYGATDVDLAAVLGMPVAHLFRLRVDMGSVSTVTLDGGGDVVEFVNLRLQPQGGGAPGA